MNLNFNLKGKFRPFSFILVFLIVLTFQYDISNLTALPMEN